MVSSGIAIGRRAGGQRQAAAPWTLAMTRTHSLWPDFRKRIQGHVLSVAADTNTSDRLAATAPMACELSTIL
jgi:hypothetical protein